MSPEDEPRIHLGGLRFLQPVDEINWEDRLKRMLVIVGKPGRCKACDLAIYWVTTRRDAMLPYTAEGLPHFAGCPKANEFRKKKTQK